MRSIRYTSFVVAGALAAMSVAAQTPLTCQVGAGTDSSGCKVVHYHVRAYRPDNKTFLELTGLNQFASMSACEAALAKQRAENAAVVAHMKQNQPRAQYQPDVFGACHCDQTTNRSSANYLEDAQRLTQFRTQQEILGKVRERLLDADAIPNSELVLNLRPDISSFDSALWPKLLLTPDPKELRVEAQPVTEAQTRATSVGDDLPKTSGNLAADLKLVDVPTPKDAMVTRAVAPSGLTGGDAPSPDSGAGVEAAAGGESADSSAVEPFVNYETARVQAVLKAANQIDDASLKKSIFEASMQRLQLLSNLRQVVATAGPKSKLASATRAAEDEASRLALVGRLFGGTVKSHWAPSDAKDIVILIPGELTGDPVAVLRESTGKYSSEQKKMALYYLLGRTSNMTSSQELWISDLMESFL